MTISCHNKNLAFIVIAASLFAATPLMAQSYEEAIGAARKAIERYDFNDAAKSLATARKKMRADFPSEKGEVEMYERQLSLAKNFIQRVEKIEILDSISVPKADFFKAYRLPASAGTMSGSEGLPFPSEDAEYVFSNEDNDFKIWAQPDSTGFYNITESIRLTDGKWSEPIMATEILGGGGNAEFPFMMPDGVTLYFASDGDESMGGYDIFVATRDAQTGEYLRPSNLGMPYNSPFDDYLLAIDEYNGVGWWATDRNELGDLLTVYLFKVNDTRVNYDPEEEEMDIADLALITDFKSTQDPEEDYSALLASIKNITPSVKKESLFQFPLSGGRVYTSFEDFKTIGGSAAMKRYLAAEKELDAALSDLQQLRKQYHSNPTPEVKNKIRTIEAQTDKDREQLKALKNEIYRAEGN